ncbi:MAG TPA: helix-turn-helix transcriptional regulator [Terriglobales bacterium]|nr:helix-turn-helix transcriptional regulator [Terriglobales bacterium]
MALSVSIQPQGRLAQSLVERMNQLDLTLRQVAERTGLTYEHVRKLAKGAAFPSRLALRELCRVLALDLAEMDRRAVADRLERKYGGIPHALAGKHPELSLLAPWWDLLTEEQKTSFRIQIRSVAESNQRMAAGRKPARGVTRGSAAARPARK